MHSVQISIGHVFFLHFRYLELSDEEREKLEGSYKVAKKLERLQSKKER